jgi:murein DD-endopeptidase MepM/ murein hydrolase activator NlpD
MKKLLDWGEEKVGVVRASRLYYAVLPVVIPLILVTSRPEAPKAEVPPRTSFGSASMVPHIDYSLLTQVAPKLSLPPHTVCLSVDSGDTLDSIFLAGGLNRSESAALVRKFGEKLDLRRLKLGDLIRFVKREDGAVAAVTMKLTGWGEIEAKRTGVDFAVQAQEGARSSKEKILSGVVESSLYDSVRLSGESPELVQQLVDIYQWDIDFFSLQPGDSFSVVVDANFVGSDRTGYAPIRATRFRHRGQIYEAFRYEGSDGQRGYYTSTGAPVRKQFLKAPLRFTRITSGFSEHRFHPLLHIFRPHHGVDYGAPIGTPVMSTADGVVVFAGRGGGEGNYIKIRHNSRIETYYLHLSRFATGIRPGTKVRQGDVIGFVGMTGLATGPHLDYRVTDGGRFLNPLDMRSLTADPLRGEALRRFLASVSPYSEKLSPATPRLADAGTTRRAL